MSRMTRRLLGFVALPLACLPVGSSGAQTLIDSMGLAGLVDSLFAGAMSRERIPGAAFLLVQNGRVVLARGFGTADIASGRAFDPERTAFPIASISKVFTATAVMQLVDRGRIDLRTDVNQYLTSVRVPSTYERPITTADLLAHTAGLDEIPGRRVRTAAELVPLGRFLKERLIRVHPPGELTSYSTYGMTLAGHLVEEVAGLAARGLGEWLTASQAIGYAEFARHLDGTLSLEDAIARTVKRTKALARRQLAWFRRDPRVRWFPAGEDGAAPASEMAEYLRG